MIVQLCIGMSNARALRPSVFRSTSETVDFE